MHCLSSFSGRRSELKKRKAVVLQSAALPSKQPEKQNLIVCSLARSETAFLFHPVSSLSSGLVSYSPTSLPTLALPLQLCAAAAPRNCSSSTVSLGFLILASHMMTISRCHGDGINNNSNRCQDKQERGIALQRNTK